ncbi:two-component system regulatory protein YycI [Paenibacillus sp. BSR1-1]|uniref:two-component system regulatory protein YycI n=1 Tax=Paenibacillus sp. BSR1-1 TaxID=3020845 RepID=UPI0025AFE747|nr:two-component system regulatory protein YycI [Paenibacillus sp. BSR1-1]MDN3017811.1 two-component system regulatory protein YycI [Paenibacillus sp. BSR1-1]
MDWSKIKTIFILTFLILDVYLLFQFMKIRDANKYEVLTEASVEEKLKVDEIKYVELPKNPIKAQYLSAKPKTFTRGDIEKLKGQSASLKGPGTTLQSTLEKPLQLSSKFEPAELSSFLNESVLYGDHYLFWEKNDKKNTITYFQQSNNMPLYNNINGMITFNYNSSNQIVSYQQTYLERIDKLAEKEEILRPLKAIETLHQKGVLKPKSKITKIELGYSTLVPLSASQLLAPTWRFVVDDKESLFVNAFEGEIINFNSEEKLSVE